MNIISHVEKAVTRVWFILMNLKPKLDLNLYNPGLHKEVYFYCEYVDFCSLRTFEEEK